MGAVANLYGFKLWHDERLSGGTAWDDRIRGAIEDSQIFVALVTNDYFASSYIRDHELPAIMERHRDHNALVLPLIYRESCWRGFFGSFIQVLPSRQGRVCPIADWKPIENGFAVAANATSHAVEEWFGSPPKSIMGRAAP